MDKFLEESFESGNVQLFVGSGLSKGIYPDSKKLLEMFLDDPIYVDATQTTLRQFLSTNLNVPLEDAAEFYELYQGPEELIRVIQRHFNKSNTKPGRFMKTFGSYLMYGGFIQQTSTVY